jgi:hypothetical protein
MFFKLLNLQQKVNTSTTAVFMHFPLAADFQHFIPCLSLSGGPFPEATL